MATARLGIFLGYVWGERQNDTPADTVSVTFRRACPDRVSLIERMPRRGHAAGTGPPLPQRPNITLWHRRRESMDDAVSGVKNKNKM